MRPDGSAIGAAFFQQSCFATYALVRATNCVRLADDIPPEIAAPLGCSIQTGAGAVFQQLGAKAGRALIVIGAGAVGLAAVMAGRIMGCCPIVVVEPQAGRRELALELGAAHGLDGAAEDWPQAIRELTGGGASAALDTAGLQETFEGALGALHPGGTLGVLTLPGEFDEPVRHPGGMDFLAKSIVGVVEGDGIPAEILPRLIEHYRSGDLPLASLIKTYRFADIAAAFDDAATGASIKPVLTFKDEHS